MRDETWILIHRLENKKIIGSKWIWRVKKLSSILVGLLKSRIVVKRFDQVYGFDFAEIFNSLVK